MSEDAPTPVLMDCDPGHDDAVAMTVEPDDVTQTRGTTVVDLSDRLPDQACNVSVAMELDNGRYWVPTLASLDSLGAA